MKKKCKNVSFNDNLQIEITYSSNEYDRNQIDSILYRKSYKRVSDEEFNFCLLTLDIYKLYEMVVHVDSLKNNTYYKKILKNYFKK